MKTADYKLAGDIPESLRGKTVKTREAESLEEMHQLVENGDPKNVFRLAQAQFDIIQQRKIRDYLGSEEVADILAGKTVGEGDDATDFSEFGEEDRIAEVMRRAQEVGDAYVYGGRTATPGGGAAAAKKALEEKKTLSAAAANDPELAEKLAALGISL